jgi:hypothetical protein
MIHHDSTLRADVYLPGDDPLNRWAFANAVQRRVDDVDVMLAPVEAVILNKLRDDTQGGSQRHLRDIREMLEVSGALVDEAFLREQTVALGVVDAMAQARRFDPEGRTSGCCEVDPISNESRTVTRAGRGDAVTCAERPPGSDTIRQRAPSAPARSLVADPGVLGSEYRALSLARRALGVAGIRVG